MFSLHMFSLILWESGLVVMLLLVVRACKQNLLLAYRYFFLYLSFVLITSASLLAMYLGKGDYYAHAYARAYWYIEFTGSVLGCLVVWEIYRGALKQFPGAARMARNFLGLVIAMVIARAIAAAWNGQNWWPSQTMIELERDLRGVQAALLIALLTVVASYRIRLGTNLSGMILGYGLFISGNVITLTLRAFLGVRFQNAWLYIQPVSYIAVVGIWCVALWSYKPAPESMRVLKIEEDYNLLVRSTAKALVEAGSSLRKALRP